MSVARGGILFFLLLAGERRRPLNDVKPRQPTRTCRPSASQRCAFGATMKDSEFRPEAERQLMEITPMAGEGAQLVTDIVSTPAGNRASVAGRCGRVPASAFGFVLPKASVFVLA